MEMIQLKTITRKMIGNFEAYLKEEEKAPATITKYLRDVEGLARYLDGGKVTKKDVVDYKEFLMKKYSPASVNATLSSLNSFFVYMKEYNLRVKFVKIQQRIFINEERELTKAEYERLLGVAKKKNRRLYLIMQTICSTGIRVSELQFITVEALREGQAQINCKGKLRRILLPTDLCRLLRRYAREQKIEGGSIFITKNGNPVDRSNVHHDMKKLCVEASVSKKKVFPHNLRHLFERTYYHIQRDIVRLADILGHSSINTTRIYTIESGEIHRRQIQNLGLLQC
jgi:site-specific recombinase XerD